MKFCLISNLYPPFSLGGAEKIVELIAKGLKQTDQVVVITTFLNKDSGKSINGNLKIYRINPGNIYNYVQGNKVPIYKKVIWHFFDLFNFFAAKRIKKILIEEKPDLVMTHNLKGLSYQLPKIISNLKIKHIHTLHDYQLIDPHGSLYREGKNLEKLPLTINIYKNICRRLFSKVDLVISPSKFVLDKHLEYGFFKHSKKYAMHNPTEFPPTDISKGEKSFSDKINLLYLGQLEKHKGIEFLIDAFNSYHGNTFSLTVVGGGALLDDLKAKNKNPDVRFLGKVEQNSLAEIFKKADLTVIPSLWWDNSPTVIYESYSYKVPVLVSDSGGSKELVQIEKTGFIFESGNRNSFTSTLDKIAQNRANLSKFGASGYEFIKEYSLDNYIAKLKELCRNLMR